MKTAVIYHQDSKNYGFGEGHPFGGDRFEKFMKFFESRFTPFSDRFEEVEPRLATDAILQLVHHRDYIEAIRSASEGVMMPDISRYVSSDNLNPFTGYIPRGIEEGSRIAVGSSLLAGELIAQKQFEKAIGIGGGLHHAKPDYGEGFCFYNDVAICVENLKQKYNVQKIFILDTDAHAGNGTAEIFYSDPQVLFIDLHQDPRTLYPGTGFTSEIGGGKGKGFTVNLPLLPGASDEAYRYLFEEIIFPLAREFAPEIIIRYGGSDPHYLDELTNLGLTIDGFKMIGRQVREIAQEVCQGESIDLLASGYNLTILPYGWSALISGLLDLEIDLSDLKEKSLPPSDYRLSETKEMAGQVKKMLGKYWRCMN